MIRMKIPFTGGCVCGAIRYECSAEPIMMFKCHCRDCQQVTGGGCVPGLLVPASAFRLIKGQLRYHFTPSMAGGRHKRGFCAECGSRITGGQSDEWPRNSLELLRAAWTIQASFVRKWIFSSQTHNRGTNWTRQLRNTNFIRRRQRMRKRIQSMSSRSQKSDRTPAFLQRLRCFCAGSILAGCQKRPEKGTRPLHVVPIGN
jgi:hypothetical protein